MKQQAIRTLIFAALLLAAVTGGALAADDDLTLAGLAERLAHVAADLSGLAEVVSGVSANVYYLGGLVNANDERLAAIETAIAPTPTPTPISTQTAARCNIEHVKEPPYSHLDCELWAFAYSLATLDLNLHPSAERLPEIADTTYPAFEAAVQFCGLAPEPLADVIYRAAVRIQRKTGNDTPPVIDLLALFHDEEFNEMVVSLGSCEAAYELVILGTPGPQED